MRPTEYQKAALKARQDGDAKIKAARAELGAAIARERQAAQRSHGRPSADEAARLSLYSQQGMALAQAGLGDLERGIRQQLKAGNRECAREFLRVGGSRLRDHMTKGPGGGLAGAGESYRALERAAATDSDAQRAATLRGLDVYEAQLGRLDWHLQNLSLGGGDLDSDEERRDAAGSVVRWHPTAEDAAITAGLAEAEGYKSAASEAGVTDL